MHNEIYFFFFQPAKARGAPTKPPYPITAGRRVLILSPSPTCSARLTLVTSPLPSKAPNPTATHPALTHSNTLRKASGSFTTRKVPAEASCGAERRNQRGALGNAQTPTPDPRSCASYLVHRLHGAAAPRSRAERSRPPASNRGCAPLPPRTPGGAAGRGPAPPAPPRGAAPRRGNAPGASPFI